MTVYEVIKTFTELFLKFIVISAILEKKGSAEL